MQVACTVLAACAESPPPELQVTSAADSTPAAMAPVVAKPDTSRPAGSLAAVELQAGANERTIDEIVESLLAATSARAPTVTIGVIDGDADQIFGRIRAVAVDAAGNIFVLDDQALKLSWFDSTGAFRGAAGRAGGGPGEFRSPVGMILDENGHVAILDMAYRRISTFALSDGGLVLLGTSETSVHAFDFCRIGTSYFVLSPSDEGMLHEVASDGSVLRSFGSIAVEIPAELDRHRAILRDLTIRGRLYCHDSPRVIVVVHDHSPMVRAFGTDGELRWTTSLPHHRTMRWESTPDGRGLRMSADPETGTAHTARAVAPLMEGVIAVTLNQTSLAEPHGRLEIRTLSLTDGRQVRHAQSALVVAARRNGLVYGYRNQPFPQVMAVDMSGVGGK